MTPQAGLGRLKAAVGLLGALMLAPTLGSAAGQGSGPTTCCFANWRYAGGCMVQIGENQQCGDVLSILNSPMSSNVGYCKNTDLRGGWVEVSCESTRGGVSAGLPKGMPKAEMPPTELAPTEAERRLGTSERAPAARPGLPTYITPVEARSAKPGEPSVIVLGGGR